MSATRLLWQPAVDWMSARLLWRRAVEWTLNAWRRLCARRVLVQGMASSGRRVPLLHALLRVDPRLASVSPLALAAVSFATTRFLQGPHARQHILPTSPEAAPPFGLAGKQQSRAEYADAVARPHAQPSAISSEDPLPPQLALLLGVLIALSLVAFVLYKLAVPPDSLGRDSRASTETHQSPITAGHHALRATEMPGGATKVGSDSLGVCTTTGIDEQTPPTSIGGVEAARSIGEDGRKAHAGAAPVGSNASARDGAAANRPIFTASTEAVPAAIMGATGADAKKACEETGAGAHGEACAAETNVKKIDSAVAVVVGADASTAETDTAVGTAEGRIATARTTDVVAVHAVQDALSTDSCTLSAHAPSTHPTGAPMAPRARGVVPRTVILREGTEQRGAVSHVRAPVALRRAETPYDGQLWQAFSAADADTTGSLSKRQLYGALAALGLKMTPSEELAVWHSFDRDKNGRVDFDEFHRLGAALLEAVHAPADGGGLSQPKGEGAADRMGFARGRSFRTSAFVGQALTRIRGLARQRSMEDILERLRRDGTPAAA